MEGGGGGHASRSEEPLKPTDNNIYLHLKLHKRETTMKETKEPKIGTWPTPEMPVWHHIQKLKKHLEGKPAEEYALILSDFTTTLCKYLEASIRSDISCLHKYIEADLCNDPKIKECLPRLCHTYRLYKLICCN